MSGMVEVDEPNREIKKFPNPVVELRKWVIFGNVDPQLLATVVMAYVFGHDKTTGLLVTAEDQVYSIGNNKHGRLGIGSESPEDSPVPVKVEALRGKEIKSFSCFSWSNPSNGICFALSNSGLVYAWGHNTCGDLGLGTMTNTFVPTVVEGLRDQRVVQLSCGWGHPLALTSEGKVFSWGCNDHGRVGDGRTVHQHTPAELSNAFGEDEISSVSCGSCHSAAVTKAGGVFLWGYNYCGQLGNGTTTNSARPVKIAFPEDVHIVKVVCGKNHTMGISKCGKLYTWGKNDDGQLGNGTTTNSSTPTEVQGLAPLLDIASINYRNGPSFCSTASEVYVWGKVWSKTVTRPEKTVFTSIQEAVWVYLSPQVMYKPLVLGSGGHVAPTLAQDLEKAFDDESTSDVQFVSEVENKSIHVHRSILEVRSIYFRTMFEGDWKESLESSVKIDPEIGFKAFHALLYFFYTDKIELPKEDFTNILDLLKLADRYCEVRLREQCELILKLGITTDNALGLYATASKHNAKDLQDFARKFLLGHRKCIKFAEQLDQVEMDMDDLKKLFVEIAIQ